MLMTSPAEAMPLALIEAMGAGIPVVSTPWLGASEMLDDGRLGDIASDFKPATVALSLEATLRDRERSRMRGQAAHDWARSKYDLGGAADQHVDLYRSLLSRT